MACLALFHFGNCGFSSGNGRSIHSRTNRCRETSHGHEFLRQRDRELPEDVQLVQVLGTTREGRFTTMQRNDGVGDSVEIGIRYQLQKIRSKESL